MPVTEAGSSISDDVALLNGDSSVADPIEEEIESDDLPEEELESDSVDNDSDSDEDEDDSEDDADNEDSEDEGEESEEEKARELKSNERLTITDLRKKYPNITKDFPQIRNLIYTQAEYTRLLPTIQDARIAVENNEAFTSMRDSIFEGDGKQFVEALKDAKALPKFSQGFLSNLQETDQNTHWQVIAPLFQDLFRSAYSTGARAGNKNLQNAASWIADYLFGNGGVAQQVDPQVLDILDGKKSVIKVPEKTENKEDNKELNELKLQRINEFKGDVNSKVEGDLNSKIVNGLSKYKLSNLERKTLVKDIIEEVSKNIVADDEHMANIRKMWLNVGKNGFKSSDKASIIDATLARASELIPSILRKQVAKALKDSPEENRKSREKLEETSSRREPGSQGKASNNRISNVVPRDPRKINWSKTSDEDFINGKVTLRS